MDRIQNNSLVLTTLSNARLNNTPQPTVYSVLSSDAAHILQKCTTKWTSEHSGHGHKDQQEIKHKNKYDLHEGCKTMPL